MNPKQNLGDTSPEDFRNQLHELADWIADFRQNLGSLPVAPNDKPGAILAALPAEPPEEGEPFEKILGDIDQDIVPGMVHWSHPMFLGYFGWTTTAPAILGEIITAPLNVNAMTWRTCPAATELETLPPAAAGSNQWLSSRQSAQLQPQALIPFPRSQPSAAKINCGFTLTALTARASPFCQRKSR